MLCSQALLFILASLVTVAWRRWRALPAFVLLCLPGLAALLAIHMGLYGSLWGGYAYQAYAANFPTSVWEGLADSLFSPNWDMLVFLPCLLLGLWAWLVAARSRPALAWL